jgi:hypothetical protein
VVDDGVREGIARGESSHLQAIVEEALSERGESDVWRNGRSKTFGAELSKRVREVSPARGSMTRVRHCRLELTLNMA